MNTNNEFFKFQKGLLTIVAGVPSGKTNWNTNWQLPKNEKMKTTQFNFLLPLTKSFEDQGFEIYLVGGSVRDLILGNEIKDFDFTTNARPEQITKLCKEAGANVIEKLGGNYGTVHIIYKDEDIEITTYRIDKDYPAGDRRPVVEFADNLTDDLIRRDFTINCLAAYLVQDGIVLDDDEIVKQGLKDLSANVLRSPQEPDKLIKDDPLRIMRAYRFKHRLGMKIDYDLKMSIKNNIDLLKIVSKERIQDELVKICNVNPHLAFREMMEDGAFKHIFPELENQVGFDQMNKHHHLGLWEHTLKVVEESHKIIQNIVLPEPIINNTMLIIASLLHDVAKYCSFQSVYECGECKKKNRVSEYNSFLYPDFVVNESCNCVDNDLKFVGRSFLRHDAVGALLSESLLKDLKFSNEFIETIRNVIDRHNSFPVATKKSIRNFVHKGNHELLLKLMRADRLAHHPDHADTTLLDEVETLLKTLDVSEVKTAKMPIDGHVIMQMTGLKPGAVLGSIMKALKESVIDGEITTEDEAKDFVNKMYVTST